MKKSHSLLIAAVTLCTTVFSQDATNDFWFPVTESSIRVTGTRQIIPQKFLTFSLNGDKLKSRLFQAPAEKNTDIRQSPCIISLPLPNGTFQRFRVVDSPVMAEELALAYPDLKTFNVKGIDDPYATGKLDWTEFGFHAMILTSGGDFFIDPYCVNNTTDYMSYYTVDFEKDPAHRITEGTLEPEEGKLDLENGQKKPGVPFKETVGARTSAATCVGANLRTYRIAIACTGEYAKAATSLAAPTVSQAFAKIVISVNRVNGVYEKEVAVRLVLVATETAIVYVDPATDPFTGNNNANTLINESQTVITSGIGTSNYDIGHTFSTGGGGLAFLGVVCNNSSKARGITGSSFPVGDPYDIDYVAHEIGHQFSGEHTFNATTGSCNGNRNPSTSVEPGSGITIMGYAGICSPNDLSNHSIPYFHAVSYDQIVNFTNSGTGNNCPVITATGNHPPVVAVGSNYTIPVTTPFILTGSATDQDGDKLYYSWEEMDAGSGSGGNWNSGNAPYFRTYAPDSIPATATSYSRNFPKASVVLSGNYTGTKGEYLPSTPQVLKFRLTVRDNRTGGGGVCYNSNNITLAAAGPFSVNYPSATGITWLISTQESINWDVNSTDLAPVSCDSVRILISYDGGATYSTFLNSTPNDGYEPITVPTLSATINTCRVKVVSIGNIFYDISNNNFTIATATVSTVGIKQVSQSNPVALTVWPNPFSGQVNLAVGNLNSRTPTDVTVVDLLGNLVLHVKYINRSELKETLDLSSVSNGVYFIKVNNSDKQSVHRVVKN